MQKDTTKIQTAIIILAAGKGTRMKSSTPKILHKICGQKMVNLVIATAKNVANGPIITVISDELSTHTDNFKDSSKIAIQTQQKGTADAVKPALSMLENFTGNVIILYADTPLIKVETLEKMLALLQDNAVVVLGFTPLNPAEYGRLVLNQNKELIKIVEFKDASETEKAINFCNSGVIAAKSDVLKKLIPQINNNNKKGEYYLTDLIELATKHGLTAKALAAETTEVLGVNTQEELSQAEYVMQQRLRKKAMLDGVTMIAPETVFFNYDTVIENNVTIHPSVIFGAEVVIKSGTEIKSFCHIEGAAIESGAVIGPFARIRPGSKIGKKARIGNFVEVKKSDISEDVKINHLSYVGDTTIGKGSNVGAGVITCNYDGHKKSKTTIGENSFIGSNSALVAPVNIGSNVMVAAGSTITKDAPDNALAIAREKQKNLEGWSKKFKEKKS